MTWTLKISHPTLALYKIILFLCFSTLGKINTKSDFYAWLSEFLQGPGISYRKDVRVKNGTGALQEITVRNVSLTSLSTSLFTPSQEHRPSTASLHSLLSCASFSSWYQLLPMDLISASCERIQVFRGRPLFRPLTSLTKQYFELWSDLVSEGIVFARETKTLLYSR